jgi:hypothetical protein
MTDHEAAWLAHQRARWLRPDAERWIRPDAARFLKPGTNLADVFPALARKYSPTQLRIINDLVAGSSRSRWFARRSIARNSG